MIKVKTKKPKTKSKNKLDNKRRCLKPNNFEAYTTKRIINL